MSGARTSGDDGWSLRLEYASAPVDAGDFPGRVQFVPFVDMGGITYNKRPWDGTGRGGRLVYGAGIEARWAVVPGFDMRMFRGWLVHDTAGIVSPGDRSVVWALIISVLFDVSDFTGGEPIDGGAFAGWTQVYRLKVSQCFLLFLLTSLKRLLSPLNLPTGGDLVRGNAPG